jgi:hypothetical protein
VTSSPIATFYLARGTSSDSLAEFRRFRASYERYKAGLPHDLVYIFKGFTHADQLAGARAVLKADTVASLYLRDDSLDIGAYFAAAARVPHDMVCFLNTASEIVGDDWLAKLACHHAAGDVGLTGCTASYEAPQHPGLENPTFPNPHLRTNAFMLRRETLMRMRPPGRIADKMDAYAFEHGAGSLTRRMWSAGLKVLMVGRDGRAFEPQWWANSDVFRQGMQGNLLVRDNRTRDYDQASLAEKRMLFQLAWGDGTSHQVRVDLR